MEYTHILVDYKHIKPDFMSKLGGSAALFYFSIKDGEECLIEANVKECTLDFYHTTGSYRYVLYTEEEITNFINDVVGSGVLFEKHS